MRDPFGHHAAKWEKHFKELVEFHRDHGHFNVPAQYANNPSLGNWVTSQRLKMRKGQLLSYRQQRLENLGLSPAYRSPQGKEAASCVLPAGHFCNGSNLDWTRGGAA